VADPDREGGGGLSFRTLGIASAASLTAALVTSRIFPPGTIYASALTPIIVTAVSEMLNRPADAVSELRKQRRMMAMEARALETARIRGDQPSPLRGAPEFAQGPEADREFATNGDAQAPPIHTYGRRRPRRILHPKVWIATGLAAFALTVAALTLPELIFGGAVSTSHRTTFFGGGSSSNSSKQETTTTTTTTGSKTHTQTVTQTTTSQSQPQSQSQTTTTPTQTTPTGTGTSTTPSGSATPQTGTGTSTSPTPGGVDTPPGG
jgi:hypothetical protein